MVTDGLGSVTTAERFVSVAALTWGAQTTPSTMAIMARYPRNAHLSILMPVIFTSEGRRKNVNY